ncbi:T3SS (YopN, CesT) and YbjN peptide-binding chaperone 1 [uncultured Tessaracoccus sp.]|uniref:T3SS (YopN, CesT) and YbjN peptide-binding chaperone 1 n=1 Tax=uncultured Tessaracoccus sp. TaxID=905023 RepID=UPI0025F8A015|nr:hypothetical protein [uncultured Tessaracoccus sp.]
MMDLENFDIDATTSAAWEAFTENLAEVLSVMDESSDLTIAVARGLVGDEVPAIRFSADGPRITARILRGLSAPGELDPSEEEQPTLLDLGWLAPDEDIDGYHASCDQEETEQLATLTTETMQMIFDVIHPVFLEPDHLKEILRGTASWQEQGRTPATPGPADVAVMPANREELDRLVDDQLERVFGHPALRNPDGEVAIRLGTAMLFLRSTPDADEIMLFSPLVHDVSGRSRACEVLNDLNVEVRYGRFALHKDRVYVQVSVPAKPFVPAHLHQALNVISTIADGIDDELAEKLGGHTTFPSA